jgi:sulfur-oxidizing protein SoxB
MVDACKLLTVDVMTGHWEFTYGMERVKEIVEKDFKGKVDFVAQNVKTNDFGDPVFAPYVIREINGVPCAIIGQAFPYTPIANPRYMVADWGFGIQDDNMQKMVDEARGKGAQVVVVHQPQRHGRGPEDGQPGARHRRHLRRPHPRRRAGGHPRHQPRRQDPGHQRRQQQQVPGRDGLRRQGWQGGDFRYRLLPVFANQLQADAEMDGADHQSPQALRGQAQPRSWRSPTACSTAVATSTAAGTS